MSKYNKQYYDDVARILKSDAGHLDRVRNTIIQEFADLFAADNPTYCGYCDTAKKDIEGPNCDSRLQPYHGHSYVEGFDREQFLTACGLKVDGD